ncbi:IclR family transcriptional regulator [Verticiella sediminum]
MASIDMTDLYLLPPAPGDEPRGTQSIGRAVTLLRAIASRGRRGIRIDELVGMSGLPKTTCVRVLGRLCREGLVARDGHTNKFYLGRLLYELGLLAQPRYRLGEACEPVLRRLAEHTRDTVYLSERSGFEAVCIACCVGDYPIKAVPLDVGVRRPLGVGVGGVAILAALDPREASQVVGGIGRRYTGFDGLTAARVLRHVRESVSIGYATGPSPGAPGALSVGVPFPPVLASASITVTALSNRMGAARQRRLAALVKAEIDGIAADWNAAIGI